MNSSRIQPDSRVGSYEVSAEIGRGALATVYRARHVFLKRDVALKVLHPHFTETPEFIQRFQEEGRVMAHLEHPNILRVLDAGHADGAFFLATSYLEGWPLSSLVGKQIPIEAVLSVGSQILKALAYAHSRGVIHRDVKPANVMVSPQGQVTVMDLGLARLVDSPGLTLPGSRIGTPHYMAPEQIRAETVDGRADLYSMGVLLYQMVAGGLPFPGSITERVYEGHLGEEPPSLPPTCPDWLRAAILRALSKSPDDRFPSAEAFLAALLSRGAVREEVSTPGEPDWLRADVSTAAVRREELAVLSLDVANSTRMKLPGLTSAIQHQFGLFRRYVGTQLQAHTCLVHVWAGDGLLALFKTPAAAAACSQELVNGLPQLNAALPGGRDPIRVRIGVHSGPVQMRDGQPLGEVVSRTLDYAGHLQKMCPTDRILISEPVYRSLSEQGAWWPTGDTFGTVFPFSVFQSASLNTADSPRPEDGAPPTSARIRLSATSGADSREYVLSTPILIGRQDPSSSRPPDLETRRDAAVSRRHARIIFRDSGILVEDLGSANGTDVNGTPVVPEAPRPLDVGDEIRVGEHTVLRILTITPGA